VLELAAATAGSARRLLARSAARADRGRDPSRQRRVSR